MNWIETRFQLTWNGRRSAIFQRRKILSPCGLIRFHAWHEHLVKDCGQRSKQRASGCEPEQLAWRLPQEFASSVCFGKQRANQLEQNTVIDGRRCAQVGPIGRP